MSVFRVQEIGPKGDVYLTRYHLTPWSWWPLKKHRLYLHVFWRPDNDRHPHDHPFDFRSIVLWGGYDEMIVDPLERLTCITPWGPRTYAPLYKHRRGWFSNEFRVATHQHIISRLHFTPTITLVIRGEKTRDWGFWIPGDGAPEFVPWTQYLDCDPEPPAYGA